MPTPFDQPPPFSEYVAGQQAPPVPPMPAPAPQAPRAPQFGPPAQPAQVHPSGMQIAALIPALLAGIRDPIVAGAAVAGLHKGLDAKRARMETAQQQQDRRQMEQADFYAKAQSEAATFDDPIAFEHWRQAITPMAQLRGIDPGVFTFDDTKKLSKDRKLVEDALGRAEKQHGAEILNRDDVSLQLADGRTVTMATARQLVGGGVTDQAGKHVPITPPSPFKTTTPDDLAIAAYAREKGKTPEQLTAAEIAEARAIGKPAGAAPNIGSFEDYVTTKYGARPTAAQIEAARKSYNQADDKAATAPRERFNVQPILLPDGTTGLVRINMDTGETTRVTLPDGAGSGRGTDTERLSKAYLDRSSASDVTARGFETQLAALGSQLDVKLPNLIKSESGQQYMQAKDEFINASLRRESGAAIQPSEYTRYDKIYFVQPGDTLATIKQKQAARERVIQGFKVAAGNMGATPKTSAKEYNWVDGKLVPVGK